jgi:hypothetical protein
MGAGDHLETLITHHVAQRIIDPLELTQIHEQQRGLLVVPADSVHVNG